MIARQGEVAIMRFPQSGILGRLSILVVLAGEFTCGTIHNGRGFFHI